MLGNTLADTFTEHMHVPGRPWDMDSIRFASFNARPTGCMLPRDSGHVAEGHREKAVPEVTQVEAGDDSSHLLQSPHP